MKEDTFNGRPRIAGGFTLIEMLTVLAIIGILASILLPTLSGARRSASRAQTRAQFSQWAAAFEQFRQEYGSYPQLFPDGAQKLVNFGATSTPAQDHLFHDLLAGNHRDGSSLQGPVAGVPVPALGQNSRRIRFMTFGESDFVSNADVQTGRASPNQLHLLRDAFYGTSIAVVTDSNLDGVINGRDAPGGFPAVEPAGGGNAIRPLTVVPSGQTGGIRAGVIFYSAPPGAISEDDLIMSWR